MTRFEFSGKKCEHVSFNFKFSFSTYLVAMKTKTYVCFISTKHVHILSLQNMWIFCRAKTCTHFGKNCIYLMGKGKEEHIIQPDENYILTMRTLALKSPFLCQIHQNQHSNWKLMLPIVLFLFLGWKYNHCLRNPYCS